MQKSLHSPHYQVLLDMLKQSRLDLGVTQEALSGLIGVAQADISKVERGVRRLDVIELRAWLRGLGVPFNEFAEALDERLSAAEAVLRHAGGTKKRRAP